jgi:hypothetical protein
MARRVGTGGWMSTPFVRPIRRANGRCRVVAHPSLVARDLHRNHAMPSSLGVFRFVFALLCGAAVTAAPSSVARAQYTFGGGPVVGWVAGEGLSLGWETTYAYEAPLLYVSAGGSYRIEAPDGPRAVHYLAWEPWALLGGSLGGAVDDDGRGTVVLGAWEAVPFIVGELQEQSWEVARVPALVVTLAIGWRWMAGTHEIYVAPKLLFHELLDPFT